MLWVLIDTLDIVYEPGKVHRISTHSQIYMKRLQIPRQILNLFTILLNKILSGLLQLLLQLGRIL